MKLQPAIQQHTFLAHSVSAEMPQQCQKSSSLNANTVQKVKFSAATQKVEWFPVSV